MPIFEFGGIDTKTTEIMTRIKFLALALLLLPWMAFAQRPVNYDESKVAPYTLEDPLTFVDGTKVASPAEWPARRREILGIFQREMYGQMPPAGDGIFLEEIESGATLAGFATRRQVRMWFRPDKTGPNIDWLIVTGHVPELQREPRVARGRGSPCAGFVDAGENVV